MKQNTQQQDVCDCCGVEPISPSTGQHCAKCHRELWTGSDAHNRPSQPSETGGPQKFAIGAKVQNIYDGNISTVSRIYWQYYAGEGTEDYTVEFAEGSWNKSMNLRLAVNAQQTDTLSPKQKQN